MEIFNENEFVSISRIDESTFRICNREGLVLENDKKIITGIVKYNIPVFKNRVYIDRKIGVLRDNEENITWFMESKIKINK